MNLGSAISVQPGRAGRMRVVLVRANLRQGVPNPAGSSRAELEPVGPDKADQDQVDRGLADQNRVKQDQAAHLLVVIVVCAPVRAVPLNSAPSRSLTRASPSRGANRSVEIVLRVPTSARQEKAVIEIAQRPEAALKKSRSGASPVKIKAAGRMPMASALVVHEPGENRVLSAHAAKARLSTGRNSTSPNLINPGSTERSQVGPLNGVFADRAAAIAQVPRDLGRHVEATSSSARLLPALAPIALAVHGPPASRSGPADRVTLARRSGLAPGQRLARGQHLARGLHSALVQGRAEHPDHLDRPDQGPLVEAHRAGAAVTVQGRRRVGSANPAKEKPASKTEAVRGAAGARVERDALKAWVPWRA